MGGVQWNFLKSGNFSIERAEGVYLYTSDGREIIDAAGGAIVSNVGHGRHRVADAVAEATRDCSYVVPPWLTPSRESLIETLREDWLPETLTRAHFTSGGSESNEVAIKLALHYQQAIGQHQKTKIIGRSVSYHGTTLVTASLSGHPMRKKGLEGALPKFCEVDTPYPLRSPLGPHHEDTGKYYANLLREEIQRQGPETVAAFLAEPITGTSGGAIVPPDDYWPLVRGICDEFGVVLIIDEVMTGFGRTGSTFGYQHWPIEPDILVGGKGLAGGYAPLGGVFATETIGQAIDVTGIGGNVVFFGLPDTRKDIAFNYWKFFMKQIQMYGVVNAQAEADMSSFHKALDWIARREIDVTKMVSHRLPLESIGQALTLAHERDEDALKVTLTF